MQKAHAFGLPADPAVPVIMIGPGTGIAPFRAFLHERMATKAPGRNWLFFGHQRSNTDFFYEDELSGMKAAQVLTRLTLAWSRDGDQKIYVQDRMREVGRDLWAWLADGAHVYVCGDAKHMARDVERALIDVVATFGARSTNEAVAFVADLKKTRPLPAGCVLIAALSTPRAPTEDTPAADGGAGAAAGDFSRSTASAPSSPATARRLPGRRNCFRRRARRSMYLPTKPCEELRDIAARAAARSDHASCARLDWRRLRGRRDRRRRL